jgi:hypothetical protein
MINMVMRVLKLEAVVQVSGMLATSLKPLATSSAEQSSRTFLEVLVVGDVAEVA